MSTMLMPMLTAPVIDLRAMAPVLIVFAAACVGVLVDGLMLGRWRSWRDEVQIGLVLGSSAAALVYLVLNARKGLVGSQAMGSLMLDGPTYVAWGALLVFGALATLVFRETRVAGGVTVFASSASSVPGGQDEADADRVRLQQTEVFPLVLFSVTGMMVFAAANDLLTLFVGLEVFSLPLYLLCGMARRRRLLSQEASLKYFLLGALSSAIFLYGVALTFGYAGSFYFRDIDLAIQANTQSPWLLLAGLGLIVVGVLFKMGAVPFHNWVPDVYQGAPTPVTGFMAICTKLAATVGLLRLLYVALGSMRWDWQPALAVIAVATMVVGSLAGLIQTDVKRLLAYSSIAHAGFILVGVIGAVTTANGLADDRVGSVSAILVYLTAYGLATMGAFAIVTLVRRSGAEATSFTAWAGLGRRDPLLGVLMTIFLLSMAGIPLTGGFIGKLAVFAAAWNGGYSWLVLIAVVASLVTAGFYFRVVWVIFGQAPNTETALVSPGIGTQIVIWVGVIGTLLLGVLPGPLLDIAINSAGFIR